MSEFVPLSNFTGEPAGEFPWSVTRKEIIPVAPGRVWRALTDPAELARWWCDRAEVDLREGGRIAFGGRRVFSLEEGASGDDRPGDFEILELAPEERLRFRWWLGNVETEVTFDLENQLELTNLRVTQTARTELDWKTDPDTPNWWWVALPTLRIFAESGHAGFRLDYEAARQSPPLELAVDVFTFPWVIWQKLTDPKELKRWWSLSTEVALEPGGAFKPGQPIFKLSGEGPQKILDVVEHQKLVHDWAWNDSAPGKFEWTMAETDAAIRVTLLDHGPWPQSLSRTRVAIERAVLLLYFKQICERGMTPLEYQR